MTQFVQGKIISPSYLAISCTKGKLERWRGGGRHRRYSKQVPNLVKIFTCILLCLDMCIVFTVGITLTHQGFETNRFPSWTSQALGVAGVNQPEAGSKCLCHVMPDTYVWCAKYFTE